MKFNRRIIAKDVKPGQLIFREYTLPNFNLPHGPWADGPDGPVFVVGVEHTNNIYDEVNITYIELRYSTLVVETLSADDRLFFGEEQGL